MHNIIINIRKYKKVILWTSHHAKHKNKYLKTEEHFSILKIYISVMAYGACLHKTGYENILSIEQFWPRLQVALHPYLSYLALTLHSVAKYENLVQIIKEWSNRVKYEIYREFRKQKNTYTQVKIGLVPNEQQYI